MEYCIEWLDWAVLGEGCPKGIPGCRRKRTAEDRELVLLWYIWFNVSVSQQLVKDSPAFQKQPLCVHMRLRVGGKVPQQFVPPTQSKKEKKDKVEKEKSEKETTSKKNSHKKTRPRLKNVDRSSAQHLEVTVGDLTVIITDFKEKTKSPPASSAASADQHSQSGSSSDNTERGMSRSSSPRGEASFIILFTCGYRNPKARKRGVTRNLLLKMEEKLGPGQSSFTSAQIPQQFKANDMC
ncbi:hypothetical protein EK904_001490 [Melospiza melodia maxima]|nr:hypothetical protein EK904_001490 [Melospiza melodia maxima]